jgi:hypothetical protein
MIFHLLTRSLLSLLVLGTAVTTSQALTWAEVTPSVSPVARSYVAMTYDATSKKVLLFGGFSGSGYLNDTWTFDGATWIIGDLSYDIDAEAAMSVRGLVGEHERNRFSPGEGPCVVGAPV